MKKIQLLFVLLCVCFQFTTAQIEYPVLTEIVTDNAGIFSASEIHQLKEKLKTYETKTTHQIVVLTVPSLQGDILEHYALNVFNTNKLGQEKADNGILILFAQLERKVKIEVGDGMTPIITDAFAKRIIETDMIPEFKTDNYYKGINKATTTLIELIDRPEYRDEFKDLINQEGEIPLWGKIILGLLILVFFGSFLGTGLFFFSKGYKQLIELFRALIMGKISIVLFPFMLILNLFAIVISLPFLLMPLVFGIVILMQYLNDEALKNPLNTILNSPYTNIPNLIIISVLLFVVLPFIIAYITRTQVKKLPIKFSLFKSDTSYISRSISSGGISSGGFSSRSSSSSSSFSGGGGSSSGGGASGSW